MNIHFDHLVHFTKLPEEAKLAFQSLGFQAIDGGKHENWGTYNALCYFQDLHYIEWIGINNMNIATSSDNPLIQQIVMDVQEGEGFSTMAFRTDDIDSLAHELRQKGLKPIGPFSGSRTRADATMLSWSMLFIEDATLDFRYPFFIQWGESDAVRTEQMGALMTHENGVPTLDFIGLQTRDAKAAVKRYQQLFEIEASKIRQGEGKQGPYRELEVGGVALRFYELQGKRPLMCGVTGVNAKNEITFSGGTYLFDH